MSDDLDFPVDVFLEGDFAPASVALAPATSAPPADPVVETRVQALERLLEQVRERRRPAA